MGVSGQVGALRAWRRGGRSQTRLRLGRLLEATAVPLNLGLSPSPGTTWRVTLDSLCLSSPPSLGLPGGHPQPLPDSEGVLFG